MYLFPDIPALDKWQRVVCEIANCLMSTVGRRKAAPPALRSE
jgi:hypothetical protein